MTEHKVRSILNEEALTLWSKKTEEERTKRIGLFGLRKEEDRVTFILFGLSYSQRLSL